MSETHTNWQETSQDCQYCGGIVLKRTDFEGERKLRVCYQCRDCGTQWSLKGSVLRQGRSRQPRTLEKDPQRPLMSLPRWLPYIAADTLLFIVMFYTGLFGLLVRFLVPLLVLVAAGLLIWQVGTHYGWWRSDFWRRE
jgi:predicted RNA-binding Zn-ribbon protein involved in translation (DUF1610 family)